MASGMLVTCLYAACDVCVHGVVVSLGGKYVFATVMCLVLHMCILTSCSSVLCWVCLCLCMLCRS